MKLIEMQCESCNKTMFKSLGEVNRQRRKKQNPRFFCSRACSGKGNHAHLLGKNPVQSGSALQKKMLNAAKIKNTKYKDGITKYMADIMRRVRKRDPDNDLDLDFLKQLWINSENRCAISNIPILLDAEDHIQRASLDRKDSSKGYLKNNVQFVSCSINFAKSNMGDDRIKHLLSLICENYKS